MADDCLYLIPMMSNTLKSPINGFIIVNPNYV